MVWSIHGDYKLPQGFKASELGSCEHAIRVKGAGAETYEIGVVKRRDGRPGYTLLMDFWDGGYGLEDAIGKRGSKLKQAYAGRVAVKAAVKAGFRLLGQAKKEDGTLVYRVGR